MTETAPENVRMVMPPAGGRVSITNPPPGQPRQVVVQLDTVYGSLAVPFEPNAAISFAAQIRKAGKEAGSGIVRAHPILLGPQGQPVAANAQSEADEDEPSSAAEGEA